MENKLTPFMIEAIKQIEKETELYFIGNTREQAIDFFKRFVELRLKEDVENGNR